MKNSCYIIFQFGGIIARCTSIKSLWTGKEVTILRRHYLGLGFIYAKGKQYRVLNYVYEPERCDRYAKIFYLPIWFGKKLPEPKPPINRCNISYEPNGVLKHTDTNS